MGFKLETARKSARVTFQDGSTLSGAFFVSVSIHSPDGTERVIDLLNSERICIPFKEASGDILLIPRDRIACVLLETSDIASALPYANPARAIFFFNSGDTIEGYVSIDLPKGRARLSDYLNLGPDFFPVRVGDKDHLVNLGCIKMVKPVPGADGL